MYSMSSQKCHAKLKKTFFERSMKLLDKEDTEHIDFIKVSYFPFFGMWRRDST